MAVAGKGMTVEEVQEIRRHVRGIDSVLVGIIERMKQQEKPQQKAQASDEAQRYAGMKTE